MELSNLEKYVTSLTPITAMLNGKKITPDEYMEAERFLARKYCIKDIDIHRPNDLIINGFRAMYVFGTEEDKNGKEDNSNKRVTTIEKKN